MKAYLGLALAGAVTLGGAATAMSVQAADKAGTPQVAAQHAKGKEVYDYWCATCHGEEARLAGTLALQTKYKGKTPAALALRTDLQPALVEYYVRNGVAWMAPFRKTEVSDADLAAISGYLTAPLEQRGLSAEALALAKGAKK